MMRWSNDGVRFTTESVFIKHAGVPSLTINDRSVLAAAFQWFPLDRTDAFDKVAVCFSETGGSSWSAPVPIVVNGLPSGFQRPFDPTLVSLPSGGYRVYFSSGVLPPPGSHPNSAVIAMYSAMSNDGISYQFEPGARFAVTGKRAIDPAIAYTGKQWMYLAPIGRPDEGAYAATSPDGLSFDRLPDIPSSQQFNWTGNLLKWGEGMRFFGSSPQGVWTSDLQPTGSWSPPKLLPFRGGDPAAVLINSKLLVVYVGGSVRNAPAPQRNLPRRPQSSPQQKSPGAVAPGLQ